MFKLVEFLQKRPSDVTIRSVRAGYGLALAALLSLTVSDYSLPYAALLGEPNATYAEYALAALMLVPGAVSAFGCCVAKRKTVRLLQITGSVLLFVLASMIVPTAPEAAKTPVVAATGSVSASELLAVVPEEASPVNVSGWLTLLAFFPLLSGITGKMITAKCLKHGEVIKKIRV